MIATQASASAGGGALSYHAPSAGGGALSYLASSAGGDALSYRAPSASGGALLIHLRLWFQASSSAGGDALLVFDGVKMGASSCHPCL